MADIIQQMIEGAAAIAAKILTGGKQAKKNEIIVQQSMGTENLASILDSFIKKGRFNEGENLLFEQLEIYPTIDIYNVGLEFYESLNKLSDSRLEECGYSRGEIAQGVQDMTKILIKITKHREIIEEDE